MTNEMERLQAGAPTTSSSKDRVEDHRPGASFADENKILREELGRVKSELGRVTEERDTYSAFIKDMSKRFDIQQEQIQKQHQQIEQQHQQLTELLKNQQQWDKDRKSFTSEIDSLNERLTAIGVQLKNALRITPSAETGRSLINGNHSSVGSNDGGDGGDGGDNNSAAPAGDSQPPEPSIQEKRYLYVIKIKHPVPVGAVLPKGMTLQQWWVDKGSDGALIPPNAQIFASHLFNEVPTNLELRFSDEELLSHFGRHKGLKSKKVSTTVYGLALSTVKTTCYQECLTDLTTGLTFRPAKCLGPAGTQISWNAMATICVMVAEFAIPMERAAKMIGRSYFSSSNISRWFQSAAVGLVDVYVALGEDLKNANFFKIDDTSSRVLDMRAEARGDMKPDSEQNDETWKKFYDSLEPSSIVLLKPVIEAFGRVSQKVSNEEAKKGINTTLITSRIDADNFESTVYFYRTHFGQAGNLLSRILEARTQTKTLIVIQGDLSSQNHLEEAVAKKLTIIYAGCSSHARRDFFRYRNDDKELAFYILRCFAALAHVERRIKQGPLTHERILKLRGKFSEKIWRLIKELCTCIIEDRQHPTIKHYQWKKPSKLYHACHYVIKHYPSLTYYLTHPLVDADNNNIEQGLRGEKIIENSACFRKSETGRVALDIHRTFIATCNAADITYADYLKYIGNVDSDELKANPKNYFPHKVAAELRSRAPPATQTT